MEVYALFDDKNAEQIILKFLQPYSKSSRVEITCLDSVPDNVRESCDKGVKEAFVMLSNYSKNVPEKISIWFRGLENHVQGNSTDLAFACAMIAELNDKSNPKEHNSVKVLFATGVINKYSEITNISGLKEKVLSAIKACKENHDNIMLFPAGNVEELKYLRETDVDFDEEINLSNLRLIPVKSLKDLLNVFGFDRTVKQRISKWAVVSITGVVFTILVIIFMLVYVTNRHSNSLTLNNDKYTFNALNTASIKPSTPINSANSTCLLSDTPLSVGTHVPSSTHYISSTHTPAISDKPENTKNPDMTPIVNPYTQTSTLPTANHSTAVMATPTKNDQNELNKIKITAISPSEGETVDVEKTKIKITFSEPGISKGPNFDHIYVNGGKGRVLAKFIENGGQILTLSLWVKYGSTFTLSLPEGAVTDAMNNVNQAQSFTFCSMDSDLSFDVISTNPCNGQVNVNLDSKVKIVFNEIGLEAGINFDSISIDNGAIIMGKKIENSGEAVIFNFVGLKPNTKYTLNIPKGSFDNGIGILNKAYTLTFTTSPQ
jgi:hypothetical protein